MPVVSGDLSLVTTRAARVSEVWVRAPRVRTHGRGVVVTSQDRVEVTGSVVRFEVLAGPAVMVLVEAGRPVESIPIVVGTGAQQSLADVVEAGLVADDATAGAIEKLAADAVGSVREALAAKTAAEAARNRAETAATTAGNHAATARTQATTATNQATAATTKAQEATTAAATATTQATAARNSATTATAAATRAETARQRSEQIATSTTWEGDRLRVNGALSPALTGPKGERGEPGATAAHTHTRADITDHYTPGVSIIPEDGQGQLWARHNTIEAGTDPRVGRIYTTNPGTRNFTPPQAFFTIDPSLDYWISFQVKADKPNSVLYMELRDGNNAQAVASYDYGDAGTGQTYLLTRYTVPTVWTRISGRIRLAPNTTQGTIRTIYTNHAQGEETGAILSFSDITLVPIPKGLGSGDVVAQPYADSQVGPAQIVQTGVDGFIHSRTNPTSANHLARKGYVDAEVMAARTDMSQSTQNHHRLAMEAVQRARGDLTQTVEEVRSAASQSASTYYRLSTEYTNAIQQSMMQNIQGLQDSIARYQQEIVNVVNESLIVWTGTFSGSGKTEIVSGGAVSSPGAVDGMKVTIPPGVYEMALHAEARVTNLAIRRGSAGSSPSIVAVSTDSTTASGMVKVAQGQYLQFAGTSTSPTKLYGVMRKIG
ncbi:hypothetical protein G7Y31_06615 [Corynebacterium lizhenjunii]|uniref:Minor tail protein n=1 Tax=Corynebacterium lizhenjunii TaxID=2709394 RepID=A0A7T0PB76_9CORY|nr:hypothetical protein [Corynebacterium lizhenjunii]QPK78257.1 hypothetical protein G7Y31_06615 [Corynebacterium lizhenjunii]